MTSPRPRHRGRLVAATSAISVILALLLGATPARSTPQQPLPTSGAAGAGSAGQPQTSATKAGTKKTIKKKAVPKKREVTKKKASPKKAPPSQPKALAAPVLTSDISTTLPRTKRGGVTGDFLGRHYDQWAIVEEGKLNIYDSPERGGGLLRSTPTDMQVLTDVLQQNQLLMAWYLDGDDKITFALDNRLSAVTLAWTPDAFYLGGLSSTGASVYRVASDGSCATRSCATWVKEFDVFADLGPNNIGGSFLSLTGLAAGTIGSTPVLAVSLSRSGTSPTRPSGGNDQLGLTILDAGTGTRLGTNYNDFYSGDGDQTTPTALAWDPRGTGLLSIGMVSGIAPHVVAHAVTVAADGTFGPRTFVDLKPSSAEKPVAVLSTAVGRLGDGRTPVIAYGLSNGSVWLWDPAASTATLKASATGTDPVDAVSFVDRVVGDAGAQDIVAVSSTGDSAQVLRYDGGSTLRPQAVEPKGVLTTDVGGIRAWYPGYKAGRLEFRSTAREPVTVQFAYRQQEAYGCWFAPAFPGSTALPATGSITLPPASLSGLYTMGGLTAAISGNCAHGTDAIGQWAAYLVVNPTARPTDRTTIKLVIDRDGTASVRAVGGSLTASVTSGASPDGYALGKTRLTINGPADPVAPETVIAKVTQLDPVVPLSPGDGVTRPVYRIDVPSTTWTLPYANPQRLTARLAPLMVSGFNDTTVDDLGYLVPQGVPSRAATSGSISLAPVSFYWQNPASGPQYLGLLISNADGDTVATVDLISAMPTGGGSQITGLTVCPVANGTDSCDGTARPFANGMDQSPLRIKLFGPDGSTVLPTSDPGYGRIYYRDDDGDLVTNLVPTDPGEPYVRVSPYPGAYPNDGSTTPVRPSGPVGGRFGYVSTTSTEEQAVYGYVGGYGGGNGGEIAVAAGNLLPQISGSSGSALTVTNGVYVTGCSGDYSNITACKIFSPTAGSSTAAGTPALFLTNDPQSKALQIGLQFRYTAQTALNSLPLQQVAGQPEHTVAAAPLVVNNGELTFADAATAFQPGDNIDAYVVVHGQQVPVLNVNVGRSN